MKLASKLRPNRTGFILRIFHHCTNMAKNFPNYIRNAAKHSDALYEAWGCSAHRRKGLKMADINVQNCVYQSAKVLQLTLCCYLEFRVNNQKNY